jgi:hypothetical protein
VREKLFATIYDRRLALLLFAPQKGLMSFLASPAYALSARFLADGRKCFKYS